MDYNIIYAGPKEEYLTPDYYHPLPHGSSFFALVLIPQELNPSLNADSDRIMGGIPSSSFTASSDSSTGGFGFAIAQRTRDEQGLSKE